MQLFSIGIYILNIDGTLKISPETGLPIPTYRNRDIQTFARAWTGFMRQPARGNIENWDDYPNRIDPMAINARWRDVFPKMDLYGGYIGDSYPLCLDLPKRRDNSGNVWRGICANPAVDKAYEACCPEGGSGGSMFCLFTGEKVLFNTAENRCSTNTQFSGGATCYWSYIDDKNSKPGCFVSTPQYINWHWTNEACTIKVKGAR